MFQLKDSSTGDAHCTALPLVYSCKTL